MPIYYNKGSAIMILHTYLSQGYNQCDSFQTWRHVGLIDLTLEKRKKEEAVNINRSLQVYFCQATDITAWCQNTVEYQPPHAWHAAYI